jgi:hypothetical protein
MKAGRLPTAATQILGYREAPMEAELLKYWSEKRSSLVERA